MLTVVQSPLLGRWENCPLYSVGFLTCQAACIPPWPDSAGQVGSRTTAFQVWRAEQFYWSPLRRGQPQQPKKSHPVVPPKGTCNQHHHQTYHPHTFRLNQTKLVGLPTGWLVYLQVRSDYIVQSFHIQFPSPSMRFIAIYSRPYYLKNTTHHTALKVQIPYVSCLHSSQGENAVAQPQGTNLINSWLVLGQLYWVIILAKDHYITLLRLRL